VTDRRRSVFATVRGALMMLALEAVALLVIDWVEIRRERGATVARDEHRRAYAEVYRP
jgi:hypothetical protein